VSAATGIPKSHPNPDDHYGIYAITIFRNVLFPENVRVADDTIKEPAYSAPLYFISRDSFRSSAVLWLDWTFRSQDDVFHNGAAKFVSLQFGNILRVSRRFYPERYIKRLFWGHPLIGEVGFAGWRNCKDLSDGRRSVPAVLYYGVVIGSGSTYGEARALQKGSGLMTYIAPPFIWSVFAVVVIYLAAIGYFMNYLKTVHRKTWLELGSPSIIFNNSIRTGFLTLGFLFGNKYRTLDDPKLAKLVWGIRSLFFVCIALMLTAKWLGYK
jgi:hypothetical protein